MEDNKVSVKEALDKLYDIKRSRKGENDNDRK